MNFTYIQTLQASLEAATRELAAKQMALVQSFAEKQKDAFANPQALVSPQAFTEGQQLVQEFVSANQAFIATSVSATQTFWRDQLAENQTAMKAAGIPGVDEVVERVQEAVQKATAKTTRSKR